MTKRRMIQHNLLKNSIAAYFAAIELHNKPNFNYRYETVTLLLINAWELLLKSFIRKYIKSRSIFTSASYTISLETSIVYVEEFINTEVKRNSFKATKENLILLEKYRNHVTHYYNEAIEPVLFSLIAKNTLDYVEFVKDHFHRDIMDHDGLFITPLGFKLPFKPEDYLSNNTARYNYSPETKAFIDQVVQVIQNLKENDIEDSIVLGFNIYLESVKKQKNSDLLVAITSKEETQTYFAQTKNFKISSDPSAAPVAVSDAELISLFPFTHKEIVDTCKQRYKDCLFNQQFHQLMRLIEINPQLAHGRKLNPKKAGKPDKYIYAEYVFDILDQHYTLRKTN